jgi:hypothetical protein
MLQSGLVKELSGQGESESPRGASTNTNFVGDVEERSSHSGSDSRIPDVSGSVSSRQDSVTESRFEEDFGTLVIDDGKSRYVNHSFWARLGEEVRLLPRLKGKD